MAFVSISADELNQLKQNPASVRDVFFTRLNKQDSEHTLDIDKSWAAIHFLLSQAEGEGSSASSLPILGGTEIGEDIGHGAIRYLEPEQVKQANSVLTSMPAEVLRKWFNAEVLEKAEVYPSEIWRDEDCFEYVDYWYRQLRGFYQRMAMGGNGILVGIV
jgi:hypothetical protein